MDALIDWIIEKNKAGYQMVNSVQRLQEMKAFRAHVLRARSQEIWLVRRRHGHERRISPTMLAHMPGIAQDAERRVAFHRLELPRRTKQCDHPHRRNRGALFPNVPLDLRLGKHRQPEVRPAAARQMKHTCERHCFSTLNHNLGYCYNDARVIKWVWKQVVSNRYEGRSEKFRGLVTRFHRAPLDSRVRTATRPRTSEIAVCR